MPTGSPSPLSTEQIDHLLAELADDRLPMVWFTPAAVGVDAGRSAKVVAMTEPPEGDFIQVRPTGSHDTLSFSPNELTMDKPPRRRKAAEPEPPAPEPVEPAPPVDELLVVRERPTRRPPTKQIPAKQAPVKETPVVAAEPAPEQKAKPGRGRSRLPAPITVTLSSTPEGEWTVEVVTGTRRSVRSQPVPVGAVASAARAFGGDIETAIDGVLSAARDQQRARVEQLEAELEAARQALADLSD